MTIMTTVRKWNYGDYKSDNYGGHSMAIQIGTLYLYFSYDTVVAFEAPMFGFRCCENVWTVTTGKHLNWLEPDKSKRIPSEQIDKELASVLKKHKLSV